jgi:D-serine dehydratase
LASIQFFLELIVEIFLTLTLFTLFDPFCMMPPCIFNANFHIYSVVVGTFGNSFLEIGIGLVITSFRIAPL